MTKTEITANASNKLHKTMWLIVFALAKGINFLGYSYSIKFEHYY